MIKINCLTESNLFDQFFHPMIDWSDEQVWYIFGAEKRYKEIEAEGQLSFFWGDYFEQFDLGEGAYDFN